MNKIEPGEHNIKYSWNWDWGLLDKPYLLELELPSFVQIDLLLNVSHMH